MKTNRVLETHNDGSAKPEGGGSSYISSRTVRILRDNLTAYLFLAPAVTLIFTFGIFPIFFAIYVSLFQWRIRQGEYRGLSNYLNTMGDVAYIFFAILVVVFVGIGIGSLLTAVKTAREKDIPLQYPLLTLIPAGVTGSGMGVTLLWAITIFAQKEEYQLGSLPLGLLLLLVGCLGLWGMNYWQHQKIGTITHQNLPNFATPILLTVLCGLAATLLGYYAWQTLLTSPRYDLAIARIQVLGQGILYLALSFVIWMWSTRQNDSTKRMVSGILASIGLLAAALYLLNIWPLVTGDSDPEFYQAFLVTIFFSVFTVPVQLSISLVLAYILYQNIQGKAIFRIIFFIPYIAPAVATAGVFQAIFSPRPFGVANFLLTNGGQDQTRALKWLQEADFAVAELGKAFGIAGAANWTFGPSLALFVVILYNIWVYVGYDTVIFLAGLGNIPNSLYEAAKIDGAGRWSIFRHITIPLLSPTTYFLSVVSVIGTFKSFNGIWVLRDPAAQGTVDTVSVHFFQTFYRGTQYGEATAMAVVLFVIILTLYFIQNRVAASKVFYG